MVSSSRPTPGSKTSGRSWARTCSALYRWAATPCRSLQPSCRRRPCRILPSRLEPPPPPRQGVEPMTTATTPVPGPGILDIAPYVGGESKVAGIERPIRLASNESALGPSPKAITAYRALAEEIHRYPDGNAAELRAALARHTGLDPERIVCGAGSDELISLLLRAYARPGDEVLYSRHGVLMDPIGAQ